MGPVGFEPFYKVGPVTFSNLLIVKISEEEKGL
jgi:hypothetical protein